MPDLAASAADTERLPVCVSVACTQVPAETHNQRLIRNVYCVAISWMLDDSGRTTGLVFRWNSRD
jgi:hypothetical protein